MGEAEAKPKVLSGGRLRQSLTFTESSGWAALELMFHVMQKQCVILKVKGKSGVPQITLKPKNKLY